MVYKPLAHRSLWRASCITGKACPLSLSLSLPCLLRLSSSIVFLPSSPPPSKLSPPASLTCRAQNASSRNCTRPRCPTMQRAGPRSCTSSPSSRRSRSSARAGGICPRRARCWLPWCRVRACMDYDNDRGLCMVLAVAPIKEWRRERQCPPREGAATHNDAATLPTHVRSPLPRA